MDCYPFNVQELRVAFLLPYFRYERSNAIRVPKVSISINASYILIASPPIPNGLRQLPGGVLVHIIPAGSQKEKLRSREEWCAPRQEDNEK